MTGFGKANFSNDKYEIEIEIKTLNSKYFDLRYFSGKEYSYLEPVIMKILKEKISRGTIDFRMTVTDLSEPEMRINEGKLKAIWEASQRANKLLNINAEMPIDRILLYQGVIEMKSNKNGCENALLDSIKDAIEVAMDNQQTMATEEGSIMEGFFSSSLCKITDSVNSLKDIIPKYKDKLFAKIQDNIKEILKSELTDDVLRRIVVEAAFYVDKNDVTEEVVRLEDHVDKFSKILENDENSCGKKLNFIVQEMHREANTLGSKFSIPETFEHILIIKEEIDKCKEMILNVQ